MSGRLALITGVLGAAWLVAMIVIGGATFSDYDHVSQYISELGATGAPFGWRVSWLGFLPVGLLICAFAWFGWMAAPRSMLSALGFLGVFLFAVGYVGAAFFPCDLGCKPEAPSFSQVMHELVGLAGYMLAPLTLSALALAARRWPGAIWLSTLGFSAALGASVGLAGLFDEGSGSVGLFQRVLEASVVGWVLACGLYLGLKTKTAAP